MSEELLDYELQAIKKEASKPKGELIRLLSRLESLGATKEVESLGDVIAHLEAWQNK